MVSQLGAQVPNPSSAPTPMSSAAPIQQNNSAAGVAQTVFTNITQQHKSAAATPTPGLTAMMSNLTLAAPTAPAAPSVAKKPLTGIATNTNDAALLAIHSKIANYYGQRPILTYETFTAHGDILIRIANTVQGTTIQIANEPNRHLLINGQIVRLKQKKVSLVTFTPDHTTIVAFKHKANLYLYIKDDKEELNDQNDIVEITTALQALFLKAQIMFPKMKLQETDVKASASAATATATAPAVPIAPLFTVSGQARPGSGLRPDLQARLQQMNEALFAGQPDSQLVKLFKQKEITVPQQPPSQCIPSPFGSTMR